jgi:hypothetical protein
MEDLEESESIHCTGCGAELLATTQPTYPFGVSGILCLSCAEQRGGSFDARLDRWTSPPDVLDLAAQAQE